MKTNPATGNTNTAPVFSASYIYTPELLHSFVKIHLWYQKRQHPLFLVTPGLFLAGCILWRLFPVFTGAAELSSGKRLEIALMGVFVFFVLWMGIIHPVIFEKTIRDDLSRAGEKRISIRFYDSYLAASGTGETGSGSKAGDRSETIEMECPYDRIDRCYVTSDCIYLYLTREQALPVPFSSLKKEEASSFQKFLLSRIPAERVSVKAHIMIPE